MQNRLMRAYARWNATNRNRHEAERLATLPHYLLRDMSLPLGSATAIARQLGSGKRR